MPGDQPSSTGGIFPHTRWSMVLAARDSMKRDNPEALEELCRIYWRPVYLFIRSRGKSPVEAEDLTQDFFHRLLSGKYLKGVEGPEKGRLRSFLCVVLKRFLADEHDRRMTQKRGGNWRAIPIDAQSAESQLESALAKAPSPDLLFDRQWALDLLDQALSLIHI